jgi:hypothetical protein
MSALQNLNSVKFGYFLTILGLICTFTAKSQTIAYAANESNGQRGQAKCTELTDPDGWGVAVREPGYYCLGQDLHQSWPLVRFPHQRVPLSSLISIYGGGVTVDLKGHRLSSTTPINSGIFTNISGDDKALPTTVKNGTITTLKTPTVGMIDAWNLENARFGRSFGLAASHGDLSKYKPTLFILENLTLKSDQHAIIMQGKRNVIRNCTIIGGNGTTNVYGPNLLFEGNTIILGAKDPKEAGDEPPVALYLEDAADSVVRNNKIVIKGSGILNPRAIVLVNSPRVLLEHNIIRGTKAVYTLLDQRSSVKALANDAQ